MKEECRVNYFLFGKTFFKNNRQNVFTKGAIISLKSSYSEDRKIWEFDIRLLWFWSHNFTTWLWVSNLNRSLFLFPWSGVTFHKVVLRIVQENTWKLQTQSFMYAVIQSVFFISPEWWTVIKSLTGLPFQKIAVVILKISKITVHSNQMVFLFALLWSLLRSCFLFFHIS